jgi:hypothetical protein
LFFLRKGNQSSLNVKDFLQLHASASKVYA